MNKTSVTAVLLIEDNEGDARLLREMLKEEAAFDTTLTHVRSMSEAEQLLTGYSPGIILLDLGLPDVQGLEAVRRAQDAAPTVPLVVITGMYDESLAAQALQEGAQDYLIKGQIETRALIRALRYAIERKLLEEALVAEKEQLRRSESRYRLIFDSASDGILLLDSENRVTRVNRKLVDMTGFSEEESLGAPLTLFFTEGEADLSPLKALAPRDELRRDLKIRNRDGSTFRAEINSTRLDDESTLCIIRDVEANREANEKLRRSEERYRGLFENAPDIIFDVGGDGLINDLNPAFELLTGWKASQFIGLPFDGLIAAESKELAAATFAKRPELGDMNFRNYKILKADGSTMDVQVHSRVEKEDGKPFRVFGWGRDVTELVRAQAESHDLLGRLEQQRRVDSLGKIATQIAHEFNNLLMGISTAVERIEIEKGDKGFLSRPIAVLNQAVQRGKTITREILRFSRTVKPALSSFDLEMWIEGLRARLTDVCGPGIEIQLVAAETPLMVSADPAQLEQVFVNLAGNARDAMNGSGRVAITLSRLTLEAGDDFVQIVFSDTGPGISAENLTQVFNPMFTTKVHGTGLGLAIIHQIVVAHEGWIEVASTPGEGTRFTFALPAAGVSIAPAKVTVHRRTDTSLSNARLLIVDDEVSVAEGLGEILTMDGYECRLLYTAAGTIEAIDSFVPDLLVLDVGLPDMSGLDLYRMIHARWPEQRVIFSSGHMAEETQISGNRNLVRFMTKPYSIESLEETIEEMLGAAPASGSN